MKKFFVTAFIIFLSAACSKQAAVLTVPEQKQTSTSTGQVIDRKSYKSDAYGFSFSHPSILPQEICSDGSCLAYFGKGGVDELTLNVGKGFPIGGSGYTQGTVAGKTAYFKQDGAEASYEDIVLVPFVYNGKQQTLFLSFNYSEPAAANDAISYKEKILATFKFDR